MWHLKYETQKHKKYNFIIRQLHKQENYRIFRSQKFEKSKNWNLEKLDKFKIWSTTCDKNISQTMTNGKAECHKNMTRTNNFKICHKNKSNLKSETQRNVRNSKTKTKLKSWMSLKHNHKNVINLKSETQVNKYKQLQIQKTSRSIKMPISKPESQKTWQILK